MRFLAAALLVVSATFACQTVQAQVIVNYAVPQYAVPYGVQYAPAPYAVRTVTTSRPVFVSAAAYGYGPGVNIAPAYIEPAAVVTRTVVARPVVTARYRPFLGGAVYRSRYRYAPANVVVTPYGYGW